jgi:hypothetical protein
VATPAPVTTDAPVATPTPTSTPSSVPTMTSMFDANYYLAHNPDVAAAKMDPLYHYNTYGWKEGRDPSADFSTSKYLAADPDVKAAGMNPLYHYVTYGYYEGRAIYPAGTTAAPITSKLVLNVSEDAYLGDAQFAVAVDGKAMGTYTATASHAAGQSQAITITGIAESFTPHDVAVTFLNDAGGGTTSADRNLYVNSIQFDGQTVPGATAALLSAGTDHFTAIAPAHWTG